MNMSAKNEDWDQEYTPKSKKYFLVCCDRCKHILNLLSNAVSEQPKKIKIKNNIIYAYQEQQTYSRLCSVQPISYIHGLYM